MKVIKSEILENYNNLSHGFVYDFQQTKIDQVIKDYNLNNIHFLKQIHSDKIIFLDDFYNENSSLEGDCLFTKTKKQGVSIFTADCVPIIIYEKISGHIAAVHAGWRGTLKEITRKTISKIKGSSSQDNYEFIAAIGPAIEKKCYEVSADVATEFVSSFGNDNDFVTPLKNGKFLVDLVYINKYQLESSGVGKIDILDYCTKCDKLLPSYRRDGKDTGRMLSFVALL